MERKNERPTQARLKELFHYDPETGIFTRRKPSRNKSETRKYGKIGAGRVSELGYVMIMVDGVNYIAGSLAWLYEHGVWPHAKIKYIDGNKLDNRISNLRVQDQPRETVKATPLTQERLKELMHYEPETGWFTWRVNSSVAKPGERVGGGHGFGYRSIGLDYKKYLEHTLAWFYMTGEWPAIEIDHINGRRDDNRWTNLRPATRSANNLNKPMGKRNSTGFPGVTAHGRKYRSRIFVQGETIDLGWFKTIAEARIARLLAEKKYLGQFTSWKPERDIGLPIGDQFLSVHVENNRLYMITAQGGRVEIEDVKNIEMLPVTDDGQVIQ